MTPDTSKYPVPDNVVKVQDDDKIFKYVRRKYVKTFNTFTKHE